MREIVQLKIALGENDNKLVLGDLFWSMGTVYNQQGDNYKLKLLSHRYYGNS